MGIIQTDNPAKEILENLQADLTQIRRKIENMNVNTNPFSEEKENISFTKLADYAVKKSRFRMQTISELQKLIPFIFC